MPLMNKLGWAIVTEMHHSIYLLAFLTFLHIILTTLAGKQYLKPTLEAKNC